jgi:hypothetical protein
MDVNAVPPILREYRLPRIPAVKAPIAETISERLNMKWLAILFVPNAAEEMTTITKRFSAFFVPRYGWRFAKEDITEKVGTMTNCAQNGAGCKYQAMLAGR